MFRFFESLIDPYPGAVPETPPRRLLAFLFHYSRPLLPLLLAMTFFAAMVSVVEVMFFAFMGELVDWLAEAKRDSFFADHGGRLLGMAALALVAFPLLVLGKSLVTHQSLFGNYPMRVRWLAHRYLLEQSLPFFQDEFAGRVSQKVMQTALAIRETVVKLMDVFVYVVVYFTGALVLVGRSEPWLMAPLLVWLLGYLVLMRVFVPRLKHISMAQADARAHMTGRIVDSYTNIQTLKLFAHTQAEQAYARGAMDGFMETVHRQMRLVTQLTVSLQTLNSLLLVSMAGFAILSWHQSLISLGAIAVAIGLVMRLRMMSDWILWEVAGLFENLGTVQDGINTIAQAQAVSDSAKAQELRVPQGEIRFDKVTFSYGAGPRAMDDGNHAPRQADVFDNLSLTLRPGERVGLVGASGAGKSTLVNLLLRFFDIDDGRILIDGQDIATVTQASLRRQIGMVTQDTSLLHRSIRDNIRYGRPEASEEEIIEAARRAHADTFIRQASDPQGRTGYDAHVGERGVKLSGGQRQRIAIARVLLKDAPILVLDEATSALDSEVEAAIQEQFYALMEGKTVIAIAHRLSTIAMLDRLVVMDQGRIIESGTHQELLELGGTYAGLWQRQSGGFLGLEAAAGSAPISAPEGQTRGEGEASVPDRQRQ
ncbi:ABC transporter ATP-binding protein [Halomonas salinarum]|uniref:ABC transporter ATP-binding protein n=1 Tax=Halomonas salinarum TaxID=1158993 RepID=UPI00143C0A2E|nr:ABC transporter ATP-binding protein [Halomonas salinarum]